MKKLGILTVLYVFSVMGLHAQRRSNYFSFGPSVGAMNYKGDLDDDNTLRFTRPGGGFAINYHFNPHMYARVGYIYGLLDAADSVSNNTQRKNRNLNFRTDIHEFHGMLVYDFIGTFGRKIFRPLFTPYVFAGASVYRFNPQGYLAGKWYALQPIGTEGQYLKGVEGTPKPYKLTQINIPMGGGFKFRLGEHWDMLIEIGARKLFTDYLDDVSDRYPDPQEMLRQQGAIPMQLSDKSVFTQFGTNYSNSAFRENVTRGYKNQKDWYFYSGIIITYVIEAKDLCPKF